MTCKKYHPVANSEWPQLRVAPTRFVLDHVAPVSCADGECMVERFEGGLKGCRCKMVEGNKEVSTCPLEVRIATVQMLLRHFLRTSNGLDPGTPICPFWGVKTHEHHYNSVFVWKCGSLIVGYLCFAQAAPILVHDIQRPAVFAARRARGAGGEPRTPRSSGFHKNHIWLVRETWSM